jgi:hypothetical protein
LLQISNLKSEFNSKFYFHSDNNENDQSHLNYYQWVSLVLFLQAFSFYIPKLIWMTVEDKKIESLIQKNLSGPVPDKAEKEKELDRVADYWRSSRGTHTKLGLTYFFCEALNLVNKFNFVYISRSYFFLICL